MNKRIKKKKYKQRTANNIEEIEIGNLLFGNSRGNYRIDRDWQRVFADFLEEAKIDEYGYYEGEVESLKTARGGFENEVFLINPYYWGDNNAIAEEPNFIFKPMNYEIDWYKYPFRDSYANKDISCIKFKEILKECLYSITH